MKNSCKWQLGSPATAERGEQPGNHWFKIHLGTHGWADTGKTAQAVPVPCLSLWLKQSSFQTCSTAGILQTKTNPKETNNQIPHPPQKSKTEKKDRKKKKPTQPNLKNPTTNNWREEKGILNPALPEGASILLREKNKPSEQLTAQVENQLENYRDKPHTFWLLHPALETHLNKSGK